MAEPTIAIPVPTSEPAADPPAPRRVFRGGFSTSICHIFRDPTRRTDCCAIACCGVLSSDRNRYLLSGELPPPLWKRLLMYLIIPALFITSLNYFAVEVTIPSSYGNNDQQQQGGDNGDTTTIKVAPLPLRLAFYAYLIFLGVRGRIEKRKTRSEIMSKLYRERASARGEEVDPSEMARYLHQHRLDVVRAHSSYSCCYARDVPLDDNNAFEDGAVEEDFCSRFWDCLSKTFWSTCCGMWFNVAVLAQLPKRNVRLKDSQGMLSPRWITSRFSPSQNTSQPSNI
jgi:hypothetical protein